MSIKTLTAAASLSLLALAITGCKTDIEDPKGERLSDDVTLIISEPEVPVDNGYQEENVDQTVANVTVTTDAFTQVIGSFDNALTTMEHWTASGIFVEATTEGFWGELATVVNTDDTRSDFGTAAIIGVYAVTTCEIGDYNCDEAMGSLTSPLFRVDAARPYLRVLMGGGNNDGTVGMRVSDDSGTEITFVNADDCGYVVNSDEQWKTVDLSAYVDEFVRVELIDNSDAGCGGFAFDHVHMSGVAEIVSDYKEANPDQTLINEIVSEDAFIQVIGSFDDQAAMLADGWIATGDMVLAEGTNGWATLPNKQVGDNGDGNAAIIGLAAGSTCEINDNVNGCDAPTGTLTSPYFIVDAARPFLSINLGGGDGSAAVGVKVLSGSGDEIGLLIPNSCGQAWLGKDDVAPGSNWQGIDLNAYVGEKIQVEIFDNEEGGCGFISFDHLHMSSTLGATSDYVEVDVDQTLANASVADDGFTQVIGSFDDPAATIAAGWIATGDFIPGDTSGWTYLPNNNAGGTTQIVGLAAGSTCEINDNVNGCDAPTGSITSPLFIVDAARTFLNINMAGGDGNADVGMRVYDADDVEIANVVPAECGQAWLGNNDVVADLNWKSVDLSAHIGETVKVEIYDDESGGCGFISFDHLHMSATSLQP
ncbi:MAG: hypothetical protein OCD00_00155 [Colwellia sp.]